MALLIRIWVLLLRKNSSRCMYSVVYVMELAFARLYLKRIDGVHDCVVHLRFLEPIAC